VLADVLCAWEVEAQQVAAIIGHALILTHVALSGRPLARWHAKLPPKA